MVSLSLAGPGSVYVRPDDTAGGLGASRSCYARYGTMVLPAGPEEAHVLGYRWGRTAADFSTMSWQTSR
jgi:hypothetical protein